MIDKLLELGFELSGVGAAYLALGSCEKGNRYRSNGNDHGQHQLRLEPHPFFNHTPKYQLRLDSSVPNHFFVEALSRRL